jgi:hypothetical protein
MIDYVIEGQIVSLKFESYVFVSKKMANQPE